MIWILGSIYLAIGFAHFVLSGGWLAMLADPRHGFSQWLVWGIIFSLIFLWPLCWVFVAILVPLSKTKFGLNLLDKFEDWCN